MVGAVMASAALLAFTLANPAVAFDFNANLPRPLTAGFYPVERTPDETFAWTTPLATITLRGIDRRAAWGCAVRVRGARPAGSPAAEVRFGVDGITMAAHSPGAAYDVVEFEAPPQPAARALTVTISTSPGFVPGSSDPRELGVQVDWIACRPSTRAWIRPPVDALVRITAAAAAFGAVFALLTPTLLLSLVASAILAGAMGLVLTTGPPLYSRAYLAWVVPLALWVTVPLLLFAALRSWRKQPLHPAAGFVLVFSAAVLFIKILTLLHPSKETVDAVFHAHRLEAVLAGHYFFTQPMPGGVRFPYAIGLYVTAVPWAALIRDHVALLRIVVSAAEAVAAALLYVAVARVWNDRLAGALAVVLYHVAPLPYIVIGNANLTYAFGQSVAVIAVSAASTLSFGRRHVPALMVLFAVTSLAFLSHVGLFPILGVALTATAVLYWTCGEKSLRPAAIGVGLSTILAAGFAVGSYYGHFPEVYSTLNRVIAPAEQPSVPADEAAAPLPADRRPASTLGRRAALAAGLGVRGLGWPVVLLAVPGIWLVWMRGPDRLTLALGGTGISFAVFLVFRVLAPVDVRYQRYADEFIDRLYYAALPAAAILAACAVARGWRERGPWRIAATAVFAAGAILGVRQWLSWIR